MTADKSPLSETASPTFPPKRGLPPFAALRAFDAVARLGGVRRAAEALSLDHAVVSRHLRTIEAWTGATLIERTRAGATLTEDGQRYHKRIAAAIDAIASATLDLMKRSDDHRLHIWCMPGFAFQWLMARLDGFQNANSNLDIELRPTDSGPDFSRHEADVDIRYAPTYGPPLQLAANVRSVEIARPPVIPVASPEYLARSAPIETPRDFLSHQLVHEESYENWRAWLASHGLEEVNEVAGPRLWQAHLTIDSARRGNGVALANHFLAGDDLTAGRLVEISGGQGGFEPVALGSYLFVARTDRWNAAPIARFRHWLLGVVEAELAVAGA